MDQKSEKDTSTKGLPFNFSGELGAGVDTEPPSQFCLFQEEPNSQEKNELVNRLPNRRKFIFSMTQGRTGTHFLTALLSLNLPKGKVHHEILGWDKFGVDTPDVSHMTLFNSVGNVPKVQQFWKQKFDRILREKTPWYAETSHLLMKAGMVENIDQLLEQGDVHFVCLKRDIVKTIISYQKDSHFVNRGMWWMWYLDPNYPRKILGYDPFRKFGLEGICLWYIYEIRARTEYYKLLLKDKPGVYFHDVELDDLNDPAKAEQVLAYFDRYVPAKDIVIPPPQGVSKSQEKIPDHYPGVLQQFVDRFNCDPAALAKTFYDEGCRL